MADLPDFLIPHNWRILFIYGEQDYLVIYTDCAGASRAYAI